MLLLSFRKHTQRNRHLHTCTHKQTDTCTYKHTNTGYKSAINWHNRWTITRPSLEFGNSTKYWSGWRKLSHFMIITDILAIIVVTIIIIMLNILRTKSYKWPTFIRIFESNTFNAYEIRSFLIMISFSCKNPPSHNYCINLDISSTNFR